MKARRISASSRNGVENSDLIGPLSSSLRLKLAAGALLSALIFGGGATSVHVGDALAEGLAIPILFLAISSTKWREYSAQAKIAIFLYSLLIITGILQLLPMPPELWTKLPGRNIVAAAYRDAGMEMPWLPVSLAPASTRQSIFALIPPLSVFLIGLQLRAADFAKIMIFFLIFCDFAIIYSFFQRISGPGSSFYFYSMTSDDFVGFFANRNHFAAMIYIALIFCTGWLINSLGTLNTTSAKDVSQDSMRLPIALFLLSTFGLLIFGLLLTKSRAGIALGIVAVGVGTCCAIATVAKRKRALLAFLTASLLLLITILSFDVTLFDIIKRLDSGITDLSRTTIARAGNMIASEYWPFGSGIGSFIHIYGFYEPPSNSLDRYVNRAHNDYIEWIVEAGFASVILFIFYLILLCFVIYKTWTSHSNSNLHALLIRCCSLVPFFILVHSFFDYPLRTISIMSIAGLCMAGPCIKLGRR